VSTYAIRLARAGELARVLRIEDDAGRLYATAGLPPDLPGLGPATLRAAQRSGLLWVVADGDDQPIAFALCWPRPQTLHLRELDVLPEHGRRGLGARLLAHVAGEASARRLPDVTLTTFAEVSWNAPYYERHGFARLRADELPDWLAQIRRDEIAAGLDRWPRIAMRKRVL
jgi:GNAT superfamily N-acetyltransferase